MATACLLGSRVAVPSYRRRTRHCPYCISHRWYVLQADRMTTLTDSLVGLGAVDMDIYGTFQLCAIGILAGPVTAKLSRTYFNDPSRNLIFLFTGLVLAGE